MRNSYEKRSLNPIDAHCAQCRHRSIINRHLRIVSTNVPGEGEGRGRRWWLTDATRGSSVGTLSFLVPRVQLPL